MERTPVSAASTAKAGLSGKARKLKALMAEWRKDRDPELNRALASFVEEIDEERKGFRTLFDTRS